MAFHQKSGHFTLVNLMILTGKLYNRLIINSLVLTLMLFLSIFSSAQAHNLKLWEQKANSETSWIQQNLVVNAKQYEIVKNTNLGYYSSIDSIGQISDKRVVKKLQQELKKNKDVLFKAVLNESQFEQYLIHTGGEAQRVKSPFSNY